VTRQARAFITHPGFEILDQRRDALAARGQPFVGSKSVDLALDLEDRVHAFDRLQSERRDRRRLAECFVAHMGGDVGEHEELAPRMAPARRLKDHSRRPVRRIEPIEAGIGVGLKHARKIGKMALGMLGSAVARIEEHRRRRIGPAKGLVVAHIMRWTAPLLITCQGLPQEEVAMTTMTIGLDISKSWFQVHGITEDGEVIKRKLARGKVLDFFARLPPCVVGLEACGSAHHWARELGKLGHEARLMPARYVRAYVKTNKHDAADAEACWEAVQRPGMRFVPVKSAEQQGVLVLHRARDLLVRQRTGAVNALRGHLAEFGIVGPKGTASARELMGLATTDERIPSCARDALSVLVEQIQDLQAKIARYDDAILLAARSNEVCRRLMKVTTIGPFAATALAATVGDPNHFSSSRHFAAWLGLVPKQHSTGGKEKLSGISKRGDGYIRKLLIHGARSGVHRVRIHQVQNSWIADMLARRPFNVVTVALAHKTARIAWALMASGEDCRVPV